MQPLDQEERKKKEEDRKKPEPLTLGDVALMGITNPRSDERVVGKKKVKRWKAAEKIMKGGTINFDVETIADIKKLINDVYPSPLIVGQAWIMLDSGEEIVEKEVKERN